MESTIENKAEFSEIQSIETIKVAILTSKRRLMDDGILLLIWGLVMSVSNFWNYYESANLTVWWMRNLMTVFQWIMGIGVISITVYYIFFRKNKVTTLTAISTRYVWIGVILAHNMTIMITKSVLNEVNFTLLHPLQMVLIGFALFVTGGIYRFWVLVISGIIMWIAAAVSANFELNMQFLIRSVAEFICFVIPGYLMLQSKKNIR